MNWDAIGAIGQMLGSVAVFVTIGDLAVQLRYAREEVVCVSFPHLGSFSVSAHKRPRLPSQQVISGAWIDTYERG